MVKVKILLRTVREEKGLSLRQLEEKCQVSKSTLGNIENGTIPKLQTLCDIAYALKVSPESLYTCTTHSGESWW